MRQNFYRQDLRGRSFRYQNLEKANFSHANIQGADFSYANLAGADFSYAQSGIKLEWAGIIFAILAGLLYFLRYFAQVSTIIPLGSFEPNLIYRLIALNITILLWIAIRFGIWKSFLIKFIACILTVSLTWLICRTVDLGINLQIQSIGISILPTSINQLVDLSIGITAIFLKSFFLIAAVYCMVAIAVFLAATITVAKILVKILSVVFLLIMTITLAWQSPNLISFDISVILGIFGSLLILKIATKEQFILSLKEITIEIITFRYLKFSGSTCFYGADLSQANFTKANLKSANFELAKLDLVCWYQAQNLEYAKLKGSILDHPVVRDLLISKNGKNAQLSGLNLKYANLDGADLEEANLSHTNLYRASLCRANLKRSNLYKAYCYETNFQDANLSEIASFTRKKKSQKLPNYQPQINSASDLRKTVSNS